MSSDKKVLPPMPKLRPRPGLSLSDEVTPPPKKRKIITTETQKAPEIIDEEAKTSRLLTKSECGRGGGRKRGSGSMIHSIPKFTQVVPKKISEVQKVLQSRLLSKQLSRQMPTSSSLTTSAINNSDSITTASKEYKEVSEFPASNMLQSIVSLHEQVVSSKTKILTPKPLPIISNSSSSRKRKPDKSSICHLIPEEPEVIIHEDEESNLNIDEPEVTITPTVKTSSILKPEEYTRLGMPPSYIFWPTANVFVHPNVLNQEETKLKTKESMQSLSSVMRVRPQRSNSEQSETSTSEVSICKFKFTGGAKPTLEEKKMMSVDSGGNFRYYSGDKSDLRAVETLSKEVMAANASHIITDRFTSLTADKLGKKLNLDLK